MDYLADGDDPRLKHLRKGPQTATQILLAFAIGVPAFLVFCVLRTRWSKIYQHKRLNAHPSTPIAPLRDGLFFWMVDLWKITDEQVLEYAGLDAVIFLGFFKMAMKFLASSAFLGMTVIVPVKKVYSDEDPWGNITMKSVFLQTDLGENAMSLMKKHDEGDKNWLWAYVVFVYIFTGLAWYFLAKETKRTSKIRQKYLGNQSTVTDRTVRLSGVPEYLRDEESLAQHMQSLSIGAVEQVVICRSWEELDRRMAERKTILTALEEAWTVYLSPFRLQRDDDTLPLVQPTPEAESEELPTGMEHTQSSGSLLRGRTLPDESRRPKMRLGWLGLFGKPIDCIDYYTVKLRVVDDAIGALRSEKDAFKATPMAFVTFKNVESAQLAAQAVLDPMPMRLVGRLAPAPSDIIWSNVYLSRTQRIVRNWLVFLLVVITTVLWFIPVGAVAVLLSPEGIAKLSPAFASFLDEHQFITSLTVGFAPTLAYTIFFALIPFIFNWMSWLQGYLDVTEIELAEISKNFAFIFFNYFIVILVASSGYTLLSFTELDTSKIPRLLATILPRQAQFYSNLIILQGIGMFPFRLLEIGTVSLYPLYKAGCKTPRDFSDLAKGPTFNYAFYLPQPLFVFVICTVYSIMAPPILCFGLIFFVVGFYVYKYQLLYAMDHPQHSTGKALGIIFKRVILGIVVFQFTMIGLLSAHQVLIPTAIITPLYHILVFPSIS